MIALAAGQATAFWPMGNTAVSAGAAKDTCKWLPWGAWAECRGVCGSGVQTRVRRCLGGIAGSCCEGRTLDSKSCSDHQDDTCSYWSGWGQWSSPSSTCGPYAEKCKKRTCYGRSTDHCHGPDRQCEKVPIENPPPELICIPCAKTCCPPGEPNCCANQCYTVDVCTGVKTILDPTPCDKELPCCSEWGAWGQWSQQSATCGYATRYRQRADVCDALRIDTQTSEPFNVGCGAYSYGDSVPWGGRHCTGKVIENAYGAGKSHQCLGTYSETRTHSCFDNLCSKTATTQAVSAPAPCQNEPLVCHRSGSCGSDDIPLSQTPWDIEPQACAKYCQVHGKKRTRYEVNRCTGDEVAYTEPCFGIHPLKISEWSTCDQTCGGIQWQSTVDPCVIDAATGVAKITYTSRKCAGVGPESGKDTWGAWGIWSDTCSKTYPAACQDEQQTRYRYSACGVADPVTGEIRFKQAEVASCVDPAKPVPPPPGPWSACSKTCVNEQSEKSIKTRVVRGWCIPDSMETVCCEVPNCCVPQGVSEWGPCQCDATSRLRGRKTRTIYNSCAELNRQETQECTPALEPRKISDWTGCIAIDRVTGQYAPDPSSCGIHSRYSCPFCEELTHTCYGVQWEKKKCQEPSPDVTVGPCRGSCSVAGVQTVTTRHGCTAQILKTEEQPCTRNVVLAPPAWTRSACSHMPTRAISGLATNNPLCPGTETWNKPALIDPETKVECNPAEILVKPCGPAEIPAPPACSVAQWVPSVCTAAAPNVCTQTCSRINVCTGERVPDQVQQCVPATGRWSPWSQYSACGGEGVKYALTVNGLVDNSLICLGRQDRYQTDMCNLNNHVHDRPLACGIQVLNQLSTPLVTTSTVAEFCKADDRYHPCRQDGLGQYIWSACTADCDASPPRPTGERLISRKGKCATDQNWRYGNEVWFSEPCSKICEEEQCDAKAWGEWTKCSSDCDVGHQHRQEYRVCYTVKYGANGVRTIKQDTKRIEYFRIESRNCGIARTEQVQYTECASVNKCGVNALGKQIYCGQGAMSKITTAVAHASMVNCPAEYRSIQISRDDNVVCELVDCPQWGGFQGDCVGCALSITKERRCMKPTGAESCECGPDGYGTNTQLVQACNPPTTWGAFDSWSECSSNCTVGSMYRHRHQICFPDETQKEVAECTGSSIPNVFMCIGPGGALVPDSESCWSTCSSNACVAGVQTKILMNPCTGVQMPKTRPCLPAIYPNGGTWMAWSQYTGCAACGGTQSRDRSHSCKQYNSFEDQREIVNCPVISTAGAWSAFSVCPACRATDATMPMVSRTRQWSCNGLGSDFALTNGVETEWQACNVPYCARWGEWVYGKCSCKNRFFATAQRVCINEDIARGFTCTGEAIKTDIPCNPTGNQLVNKAWWIDGQWGEWSQCPAICSPSGTCDASVYQQTRTMELYCLDGSVDATGQMIKYPELTATGEVKTLVENNPCECTVPTPTYPVVWSTCDSPDAATCPGKRTGYMRYTCGTQTSPVAPEDCGTAGTWGAWSGYSECSASCNGGTKTRTRYWTCTHANIEPQREVVSCNEHFCNYYGAWSNWSACTVSCGIGTMTRTRYCHGGNDGTGHCLNDGIDVCSNLDKENVIVGKTDCAKCDMGQCCEWDWSGWTGCCNSGAKNIRLRFKGNKCGQNWEFLQKDCEQAPQAYTGQTAFPSCEAIKSDKLDVYGRRGNARYVINPDTIETATLPGQRLGHADNPNLVNKFSWNKPIAFTDTRTQAPWNNPTSTFSNLVSTNVKPAAVPVPVVPIVPVTPAKPQNSFNFLFNNPQPVFQTNNNANTPMANTHG